MEKKLNEQKPPQYSKEKLVEMWKQAISLKETNEEALRNPRKRK